MTVDEARLRAAPDAKAWAEEFTKKWSLAEKGMPHLSDDDTEAVMLTWFANAMCIAVDDERRRVTDTLLELHALTTTRPSGWAWAAHVLNNGGLCLLTCPHYPPTIDHRTPIAD